MVKAIVDTEEIHMLSYKNGYFTVYALEKELGFDNGEILGWRAIFPETKKLFSVADALGVDINKLLIVYDPKDENTIVLHRPKLPKEYWILKNGNKTVYMITCKTTNRSYIGSSINAELRVRNHMIPLSKHKHTNKEMQKDFDKYGEGSFDWRILGNFSPLAGSYLEYLFMLYYNTRNIATGYNFKDNHGVRYKDVYLNDIEMLTRKANEKSLTVEELLKNSKIVVETVKSKETYKRRRKP